MYIPNLFYNQQLFQVLKNENNGKVVFVFKNSTPIISVVWENIKTITYMEHS